ncbi:MAG: SDR family oxidoreductase, partial [Sphingomonas sp.]
MGRAIYPSLMNKRVIITGGGSGIGAGLVEAFVGQGSQVAFVDVMDEESRDVVARLAPNAVHVPVYQHCDLTDTASVKRTMAEFEDVLGGVDILINNAANDDRHTIEEVTPEYWDERMAVNLRHQFFAAQAVVPAMKRAGQGVILNFGSISWHLALPDLILYQTAKAAIEGMTRSMARDLGRANIRVNTVVPGNVQTPRQMKWYT